MRKILFADSHYFHQYSMLGLRQYALQFANHDWDIAYITNPLSPLNTIFAKDKRRIFSLFLNHIRNGVNIKKNLWWYVPFTYVPFHNHTPLDKQWFIDNYYRFMLPPIKSVVNKKGFSSVDVLCIATSHQKFWKDILDYKCCIFRLGDNTGEFPKSSSVLLKAEEEVIQSSDFILVASKVLLKQLKNKFTNKEIIYSPNGVDLSNFIRTKYHRPDEFQGIRNRIALYIGAIGEWFDRELLMNIARHCPEISFLIIGTDRLGKLRSGLEPNVYYLGPKKYKEIPNYIYYCDCGIIPFDNSKLVQSISPIKMYEFFSLGKPVISREWEELKLINSPCLLANNVKEFVDILKDNNTFSANCEKLSNYARQNTWNKRYLKVVKRLETLGV